MKKGIIGLLVLILGGAGFVSWKHHEKEGKWPWASMDELKKTGSETKTGLKKGAAAAKSGLKKAGAAAKIKGSEAWKWTTANTDKLYRKSKGLLAKLGHKEEGATAAATTARVEPPVDPLDAKSQNYKYGKDWLKKGVAEWQVGLVHPGAAARAQKHLKKAVATFTAARMDFGGGNDTVEEYLLESQTYLNDTNEMLAKIEAAKTE